MKKIVEKLNKLTLFDKFIIVLTVLGSLGFAYALFRKSTPVTFTIKVGEDDIRIISWPYRSTRIWFSELFYEGMKEKDGLGRTNAEVVKIYSYDTAPERKALYLTVRARAVYSRSSNQYTYKGNPILIGAPIKMFLDRLYVEGIVTHMKGVNNPRQRESLIVNARLKEVNPTFTETTGVDDYLASTIKEGQEIKDSAGNTMIKVVEKKESEAKKAVTTADGRVIVQTQPFKKDVDLILEINAIKISGKYFLFDDVPILVGFGIPLNFSTFSIWPEVTSITPE